MGPAGFTQFQAHLALGGRGEVTGDPETSSQEEQEGAAQLSGSQRDKESP